MTQKQIGYLITAVVASFITFWCLDKAGIPNEKQIFLIGANLSIILVYDLMKAVD